MTNFNKILYRKGEVPEELEGRGMWVRYGKETLFRPFGPPTQVMDWKCEKCGYETLKCFIMGDCNYFCPSCNEWAGFID